MHTRFSLDRSARALRAGASRDGDGERARRRSRPRSRLSQPHPAPLRRGRPARQKTRAPDDGRQSLICDHGERPQGVRAAQQGLARPGRRDAGAAAARRAGSAWSARWRRSKRCSACARRRAEPDRAAAASARRHGLGHLGARRDLRAGIRLGHHVRGAGRARSPPTSSTTSIPGASAAGSPSSTASASARCSWCARPTRSRSCACSSSIRRRAGSGSARGWSRNACASPRAPAIRP